MFKSVLSLTLAAALGTAALGQTTLTAVPGEAASAKYASIKQEILRAIEKGNEYLKNKQNPEGYWAQPSYPALTALAVTAYMRDPENQGKPLPEYIRKGYDFILKSQKEDGSIFNRGMSSYNTAVCMMALLAANKEEYAPAILKAHQAAEPLRSGQPLQRRHRLRGQKGSPHCGPLQHLPGPGSHLLLPETRQGRQIRRTARPGLERGHGIHQPLPAKPRRQQGTLGIG